jgi:hypothetical protein
LYFLVLSNLFKITSHALQRIIASCAYVGNIAQKA